MKVSRERNALRHNVYPLRSVPSSVNPQTSVDVQLNSLMKNLLSLLKFPPTNQPSRANPFLLVLKDLHKFPHINKSFLVKGKETTTKSSWKQHGSHNFSLRFDEFRSRRTRILKVIGLFISYCSLFCLYVQFYINIGHWTVVLCCAP